MTLEGEEGRSLAKQPWTLNDSDEREYKRKGELEELGTEFNFRCTEFEVNLDLRPISCLAL